MGYRYHLHPHGSRLHVPHIIDRAETNGTTQFVDRYSAGCQVFQRAPDFEEFMVLAEKHRALYGNVFTYTLIDFRAISRITLKRIVKVSGVLAVLVLGWMMKPKF